MPAASSAPSLHPDLDSDMPRHTQKFGISILFGSWILLWAFHDNTLSHEPIVFLSIITLLKAKLRSIQKFKRIKDKISRKFNQLIISPIGSPTLKWKSNEVLHFIN